MREDAHRIDFVGLLVGLSVGDALGLPWEMMGGARARRIRGDDLEHRFLGRWGMWSDDTEHTFLIGQVLLVESSDADAFARALADKLVGWLLGAPAGAGRATIRGIARVMISRDPASSGIWSGGNGPSMRAPLLGAYFAHDSARRASFTLASTRITHSDPRALIGALAVAEVAATLARGESFEDIDALLASLTSIEVSDAKDACAEWIAIVEHLREAEARDEDTIALAARMGLGDFVTGYTYHTVPVALYAWWRHRDDARAAIEAAIVCGGDVDTIAAITGALVGLSLGEEAIPSRWRERVAEWPRTRGHLIALGERLSSARRGEAVEPLRYAWPLLLVRNLFFLLVVMIHTIRRILPPYRGRS